MISAFARYEQLKSLNSAPAQPEQRAAEHSAPPCAPGFGDHTKTMSISGSRTEVLAEKAFVFCSGKVVAKSLDVPVESSRLDAGSFETNDSALGESLSETDAQKQEPPVSPSSLIVKSSTISPGRINGIERRGPIPSYEQSSALSVDQERQQPIQSQGQTPCLDTDQGDAFSWPHHSTATPLARRNERRGRPPGSKNKSPSTRSKARDRDTGGQGQTSMPPSIQWQHRWNTPLEKKTSSKLSEAMKAIWAKRRSNGTDGHRGGPPTEQTLLKRQRYSSLPHKDPVATTGQLNSNPPRQLFKGQHAIRSASGPRLPTLAPKPAISARNVHPTVQHGFVNTPILQSPAAVTPSTSLLPPGELPTICNEDLALTRIFNAYIYPALTKLKIRYEGTLPNEILLAICKQVSHPISI